MKAGIVALVTVLVLVVVVALIGGSYVHSKNTMISMDEDVNNAYSTVNVQQQRRLDLIPNLVNSVKGYVKEEETVLTNIANARAGVIATASDKPSTANIQANERLSATLIPLFRLQEAYPNLKSDQQFMRLEDELSGTENRISVARQRYNTALRAFNVYVRQFPNSIWANFAGFHAKEDQYFQGNPQNNVAPTVDFNK